MLRVVVLRVL
ncbi:hypothetical protein ECPA4_1879, partial [Escherichia coli PA4]